MRENVKVSLKPAGKNGRLKLLDAEYQEMIRKANEEFGMDEYYRERVEHFRRIYKAQERRRLRYLELSIT